MTETDIEAFKVLIGAHLNALDEIAAELRAIVSALLEIDRTIFDK